MSAFEAFRARLRHLVDRPITQRVITALIALNAVTLGLETSETAMVEAGDWLHLIDQVLLGVFVLELSAKMLAKGGAFWRDPWNVFDTVVVGIALVPTSGPLSVLRALRVLRVLRLISLVPSMRGVVEALLKALPGMGSILALLGILFYVGAVMATKLYGAEFPALFGTLGRSAFTLFQVMTLEGWSAEVVRPVMDLHPQAWLFFIPFILTTTFAVLNLFIAIIVNAMQERYDADHAKELAQANRRRQDLAENMAALRSEVAELKTLLVRGSGTGGDPVPAPGEKRT
ncbi:MAG TPA: ion transporter [Kiloniellales bacterium]|nr:ion transporter [Kiloniellales bacterium]